MLQTDILICPYCKNAELSSYDNHIVCHKCNRSYPCKDGVIDFLNSSFLVDQVLMLTYKKFDEGYSSKDDSIEELLNRLRTYKKDFFHYVDYHDLMDHNKFRNVLEIGSGEGFWGTLTGEKSNRSIIYIDISLLALKNAKKMADLLGVNGMFLRADINKMPLKSNSIDFSYGGGVIEHFRSTATAVKELHRVTRNGGIAINTVPIISLFTLTYCQIWGNIPNIPILQKVFEFFHFKVLGGKHMKYGYELSFTIYNIKKLFSSFRNVKINLFYFGQSEWHIPYKRLRGKRIMLFPFVFLYNMYRFVYQCRMFWNIVKIEAKK